MKRKIIVLASVLIISFPKLAFAHCPLCTIGAGALAVMATSLGVSTAIIGVLIGAFAMALGLWIAPMIKREFIPLQKTLLALLVFMLTVIPIMPLAVEYAPFYVSLWGDYGTWMHNTYTINLFVFGSIIGAIIIFLTPSLSRLLTRLIGKKIPYQGLGLTIVLLILVSVVIQLMS